MSINPGSQNYKSSNLSLCAGLIAAGHKLVDIDASMPRRVLFVILDNSRLSADISSFYGDSLLVNARSYFDAIKLLKSRMYGG